MIRGTKATMILKPEIESGLIEIKHYKEFIEYWIYKDESVGTGTINSKTGEYVPGHAESAPEPRYLKCIIVCEDKPEHIMKDGPAHFLVTGAKFDDIDYPDLTDYLCKTERPPQA
jgi:hypothetical protein